jgi:AraC-like DNA-binding protein
MTGRDPHDWLRYRAAAEGTAWAEAFFARSAFSPHRHDTYAIGYTTIGVQTFTYRGAALHSRPGDVFVLHPDELHDGRPGTEAGYGYRIVYIAPELIGAAAGGRALPFVAEAVSRHPRLKAAVVAAFPVPGDAADALRHADAIAQIANALNDASGRPRNAGTASHPAAIHRIRDQLMESAGRGGVDLPALEREHGLDRYAIARHFRRAFGVAPHRFRVLRRLDLARRCIEAGESLADAALAAGFADQSHMTRHFRAVYGVTPGQWRSLLAAPIRQPE